MAVSSPLHMNKVIHLLHLFFGGAPVLGISSAIPAGPNGWRVNIGDIFCEIAAANTGHARRIELVSFLVESRHKRADRLLIFGRKLSRPIIFIAESPEDDCRTVVMLIDHVAQHAMRLLLPHLVADSTA